MVIQLGTVIKHQTIPKWNVYLSQIHFWSNNHYRIFKYKWKNCYQKNFTYGNL